VSVGEGVWVGIRAVLVVRVVVVVVLSFLGAGLSDSDGEIGCGGGARLDKGKGGVSYLVIVEGRDQWRRL